MFLSAGARREGNKGYGIEHIASSADCAVAVQHMLSSIAQREAQTEPTLATCDERVVIYSIGIHEITRQARVVELLSDVVTDESAAD
jgi:hypothetical protein